MFADDGTLLNKYGFADFMLAVKQNGPGVVKIFSEYTHVDRIRICVVLTSPLCRLFFSHSQCAVTKDPKVADETDETAGDEDKKEKKANKENKEENKGENDTTNGEGGRRLQEVQPPIMAEIKLYCYGCNFGKIRFSQESSGKAFKTTLHR